MIKKLILVVFSLPFIVVGVAYLLPDETTVSRSIVIEADAESVFSQINNFKKFQNWSPWAEKDKDMKIAYEGPVTGGGAKMSWQSQNREVGSGSQEIIESKPFEKIHISLSFEGQKDAQAYFHLKTLQEKQTQLTWSFVSNHGTNPLNRYVGLMLDTWVGKDYEKGLANLKKWIESDAQVVEVIKRVEPSEKIMMVDENGKVLELTAEEMEALNAKHSQKEQKVPEEIQKAIAESVRKQELEMEAAESAKALAEKKAAEEAAAQKISKPMPTGKENY